ncbi:Sec-independent protein translocase subunit TatA/TatB [Gordonibacter pamelaeae]|uniref:Translocase n=1 Tax=Gordonibacter pamelaeae TaxID=471189 RepID=A0A369LXJ4_9ACTN|nr:twin-arginine translocase TatA/TatE family subunit [Gordonibacter pamelaeae]RDB64253.1 translocase [Gordonibacter pamelaeae]
MFGIGGFELFLILLFGFLIFGPDKLPAMAKTLGKAIAKFKDAQEEMNKVIKTEVYDPNSDEPFKNPLDALAKVGEIGKDDKKEAPAVSGKQESFSERKARYDKERAAKKAEEAKQATAAATAAAAGTATAAAAKPVARPDGSFAKPEEAKPVSTAAAGASPAKAEAAKPVTEPKAKPSADELYGTKPAAKKPAAKPATKSAAASGEKKTSATTARKTSAAKPAKTEAEKAAARSAAAKKAAATRAAKKKAAEEAAKVASTTTNEKGE